jgi:hypothetical protein
VPGSIRSLHYVSDSNPGIRRHRRKGSKDSPVVIIAWEQGKGPFSPRAHPGRGLAPLLSLLRS